MKRQSCGAHPARNAAVKKIIVQYAVMTPQPNNQGGNTFMYGHYRRGVFSTLHNIQPGEKAIVRTVDGKTFTYVLAGSQVGCVG